MVNNTRFIDIRGNWLTIPEYLRHTCVIILIIEGYYEIIMQILSSEKNLKKFYHELKLFKTYHSTMDTTATRTRHIWEIPLLLQVPKLKTTQRRHTAFENFRCSYKYKNEK